MEDESKAKGQLIKELARLRSRVAQLEAAERGHRKLQIESDKNRDLLASILENAPYGIGMAESMFGRVLYQNREFTNITGYSLDDVQTVNKWFRKAYPDPKHRRWIAEDWRRIHESGRSTVVARITCKDGDVKDVELKTVPLTDGKTLTIFADVTRREQAEAALKRAHEELESRVEERTVELVALNRQLQEEISSRKDTERALEESRQQLRNLSQHLQSAREEERKRIAREVHDELGQALSVLKIDARCLGDAVNRDHPAIRERIEAIAKGLDVAVQSVRKICADLRPAMLDHFGLPAAIEWQAGEFQKKTGIQCSVSLGSEEMDLDHDASLAVFRMFQETLTNIMRHSGANYVTVGLVKDGEGLTLRVEDNGRGITKQDIANPRSFGIIGMIERAHFWHGTVQFDSVPGKGTTVTIRIPIK